MKDALQRLKAIDSECHLFAGINALLGWDQETYMPPKGLDARGEQLALIEGLSHERLTGPDIPALLASLGVSEQNPMGDPSLDKDTRSYLRAFYRMWSREVKLPGDFVRERAKAVSLSQAAWADARAKNDFSLFEPHLEKMIGYAKREAAYLGYGERPYDGLLDLYEAGLTVQETRQIFSKLKAGLVSLLAKIGSRPQVDDCALKRSCPIEKQEAFSRHLMPLLGYDLESGRLDPSAHPFTTSIGEDDIRITTRYLENDFGSSISSTIHETGHALYELGLPRAWARTVMGEACSTAVHESQSRFWENIVGRSLPFWKGQFPRLKADLSPVIEDVDLEGFYRAFNKVEPSYIRVDADEVTYSLHVILRFELESDLMEGRLKVADLPSAWNLKMKELLGISPPSDALGCLQDIHWSMGAVGYFPGYALGNLYAAQFTQAMVAELGPLESYLETGNFTPILSWLRRNIHERGAGLLPSELVKEVCGSALSHEPFLDYLNKKYAGVYGF